MQQGQGTHKLDQAHWPSSSIHKIISPALNLLLCKSKRPVHEFLASPVISRAELELAVDREYEHRSLT